MNENNVMYDAIVEYYQMGLFTPQQVNSFVGLWITQEQANQIINSQVTSQPSQPTQTSAQ